MGEKERGGEGFGVAGAEGRVWARHGGGGVGAGLLNSCVFVWFAGCGMGEGGYVAVGRVLLCVRVC